MHGSTRHRGAGAREVYSSKASGFERGRQIFGTRRQLRGVRVLGGRLSHACLGSGPTAVSECLSVMLAPCRPEQPGNGRW